MKLVALPPSFLLAQGQLSEFADRASWDWVKPNSIEPRGSTGVPFPGKMPVFHTLFGMAVRTRKGFRETGQDGGKANCSL